MNSAQERFDVFWVSRWAEAHPDLLAYTLDDGAAMFARLMYLAGYAAGAEDMRERAAMCANQQTGGFSACLGDVDEEGREFAVRDKDGPWVLTAATAKAIRALSLTPEDHTEPKGH